MFLISSFKKHSNHLLRRITFKVTVLILLILPCIGMVYYCHVILGIDVVFTHFFYVPIILAGFWWGRRTIWVAILLGGCLMASHALSGLNISYTADLLRLGMFIIVGFVVGTFRAQTLKTEWNLRETRDYLDSLIRCANAPVIVWDKEGKIILFNNAFERLTGYRSDEVIGKPLTTIFNGASKEASLEKIEQTLKGQRWEAVEIPTRCKDGEERILLWNSANIYAPDGKTPIATIAQGQDITLRKQAEEALNLRVDELEAHGQVIESRLERRIRELAAHKRIVDSMLRTLDLDERLEIGLKEIMNLTGAEKAGVSLVEGNRLVIRKQFGFSKTYLAWAGDLAVEDVPSCEEITIGWNDIPDPSSRLEVAFKKERLKSWVTVPLKSEQDFLGIFTLASHRPQAFPQEQIDILSALANSLTLMLQQASLYRMAQERLARLTTLREIDQAISANLSMEGIIEVVLQKVSPHIWVDAVGISLIDWERKRTMLARLHLPGDVNIEGEAFGLSDSLLAQLGVEKRPVIIYDVKSDPRLQNHRDIVRKYNLSSYVGMPLVVQDRAIGVLHLFTVEPHQFSQEDLNFFATMAGQAAISVQNARLYEEAKQRAENMESLAKTIFSFSQIGQEKELSSQILATACGVTGAEIGELLWYNAEMNTLELIAGVGISEEEMSRAKEQRSSPVDPKASLVGRAAFTREPVYVPDVSQEPRWRIEFLTAGSAYIVPLMHREHLFGVYTFLSRKVNGFSPEQRALAETFAGYVSSALENIRLSKETQRAFNELRTTQKQLLQAQKMEAIGILAGGIAHDFNNILAPIMGYTEIALSDLPAESETREDLKQVLKAAERARDLVAQILAFSRQTIGERKPIELVPIVKEALKLLRAAVPTTIEIRQDIAPDTWVVNADPTQIHQILMNLCTNAAHAMPKGGVLEVSLANVELDEKLCAEFEDLTPGSYVRLTVRDTGCGMDKKTLEHIFDPFFTTKAPGEGTGMGLSVVHGIVKSYGGDISVHSEPGVGTTVYIYLPVVKAMAEVRPETAEPVRGGTESILFVDDEVMVVEMGRETLKRLGYRVTTRTSSIEALELFRVKPGEFDLVITDQTMPNMTGDNLAVELLRIRPDIPIILCTGFSHAITPEKASALGIREFVMKPIVGAQLGRVVRRVLDESSKKEKR